MKIVYDYFAALKCKLWTINAGKDEEGKGKLTEVGWLGKVEQHKSLFRITDVFLLPHRSNSSSHYNVDEEEVAKFYAEYIQSGGNPGDIKHFGHSHGTMSSFQSPVDKDNVDTAFARKNFCVAVTWNVKGELYGEVTMFNPFFYRFEKVPVEVEDYIPSDTYVQEVLAELRSKVPPERSFPGKVTEYLRHGWHSGSGYHGEHGARNGSVFPYADIDETGSVGEVRGPSGGRSAARSDGHRTPGESVGQQAGKEEEEEGEKSAQTADAEEILERLSEEIEKELLDFEGMCVVMGERFFEVDLGEVFEHIVPVNLTEEGDWEVVNDLVDRVMVLKKLQAGEGFNPEKVTEDAEVNSKSIGGEKENG